MAKKVLKKKTVTKAKKAVAAPTGIFEMSTKAKIDLIRADQRKLHAKLDKVIFLLTQKVPEMQPSKTITAEDMSFIN